MKCLSKQPRQVVKLLRPKSVGIRACIDSFDHGWNVITIGQHNFTIGDMRETIADGLLRAGGIDRLPISSIKRRRQFKKWPESREQLLAKPSCIYVPPQ
jgi:hypothetical protein